MPLNILRRSYVRAPLLKASSSKLSKACRSLLLVVSASIAVPVMAADDMSKVMSLLGGMSQALREKSYQGLFTYEHGGALETLKVSHQVAEGIEVSSLEHLNGPAYKYSPQARKADCLTPSDQRLRGILPALEGSLEGLESYYHFYIREDQRVAGREVTVLQIVPRDEYRFGHTFSIDKETFLPLGAMIFTPNKTVLERLQFVDMKLLDDVAPVALAPSAFECEQETVEHAPWVVQWMPGGFMSAGMSSSAGAGDMMMFTDGLASFSVFVRPSTVEVAPKGKAQRGATVAYMQQYLFGQVPYTVSVVGELPARTAQRIANSIRPKPQG